MVEAIILFDGVCNLCNGSVRFIIKRDPNRRFRFASFQSEAGAALMKRYNIPMLDGVVLIEKNAYYTKSTAAIRIGTQLTGAWKLVAALRVIPVPLRDFIYNEFAKRRYAWFGKSEQCLLPTPELRQRFID